MTIVLAFCHVPLKHLAPFFPIATFKELEDCQLIPTQPPLLQAKQMQFPQLVHICHAFQPPAISAALQWAYFSSTCLLPRGPELHRVFQMWLWHVPQRGASASLDLLAIHKPAHNELSCPQAHPTDSVMKFTRTPGPFYRAAPQPVLLHGVITSKVQDLRSKHICFDFLVLHLLPFYGFS